jgi:hypothetical protein
MIKHQKETPITGLNNAFFVEDYYEDEAISKNSLSSIDDFYNLIHLIQKSWSNKKYHLVMEDAGYDIYDKKENKSAWIGVKEKCDYIMFILYYGGRLYEKAYRKYFKNPMVVYDFDEDLSVYSDLQISEIIKGTSFEKQKEIIVNWIKTEINKIL